MTADHTPEREPLIITIDLAPNPETIRSIVEGLARASARPTPRLDHIVARRSLAACLDGDDDQAAELLAGLDDAALYAIEGAGSALAIHASRLRKDLLAAAQAEDDGQGGESVCDEPTCICHDLAADDEPDEQLGASTTLEAIDEITGLDHLAPWERDLLTAKADEQQAELAAELRNAGVALDAMQHRAETAERSAAAWQADARRFDENSDHWRKRADEAGRERDTAREALDAAGIVIASLRDQRDEQRQRAARANVQATALLRRAETAERQAAEQKTRAQRAEADAADWRTTAHGYEQALRAEQAETSLQVTRLTRERDDARARLAKAREEVDKASRAGAAVLQTWVVRALLGIPDGTDAPDAWRP